MKSSIYIYSILFVIGSGYSSCKKYLDEIPDKRMATVNSIGAAQALLDNSSQINEIVVPNELEIGADNYYLTETDFNIVGQYAREQYTWSKAQSGDASTTWLSIYTSIYNTNLVLEALPTITSTALELPARNNVEGSALFLRAFYFYNIAQLYAPAYNPSTAASDAGIPLRVNANFNEISTRPSVAETYSKIVNDLKQASSLLPVSPVVRSRPSKSAAYGALARTYLIMSEYDSALLYADKCLGLYDSLINFNTPTNDYAGATATAPFRRFNRETIFFARGRTSSSLAGSRAKIDSNLYLSYVPGDLRKIAYFRTNTGVNTGTYGFKGDYDGRGAAFQSGYVFGGIVTDEIFLIRAECHARAGNVGLAMNDLNTLLETRWDPAFWTPFAAADADEALELILTERRKELLYRGLRWTDLRRFKSDSRFTTTPRRKIGETIYELEPTNNRYTLLIPGDVIVRSGMTQNP